MSTVEVRGARKYFVDVHPDILADSAVRFCEKYGRCFILTDANVAPFYLGKLAKLPRQSSFVVPAGEDSKSFATLERVLDAMIDAGLDRSSALIALGGGVVGDLGGLASSLYMRGIEYVSLPTTLLAMVDASVGGKTAVNLSAGKNLAGTFHDPRHVFADTTTLATLPDEEFRSGLGEVVKSAILGDFLDRIAKDADKIARRDPQALAELVHDCVALKAGVVARDPFEKNVRKHLNLGHTFAHGIEHAAGYGRIPHGIAVGVGLVLAIDTSRELGKCTSEALGEQTRGLLETFGVPTSLGLLRSKYDSKLLPADIVKAMRHDKKGQAGKIRLVLPVLPRMCIHDVVVEEPMLLKILAQG